MKLLIADIYNMMKFSLLLRKMLAWFIDVRVLRLINFYLSKLGNNMHSQQFRKWKVEFNHNNLILKNPPTTEYFSVDPIRSANLSNLGPGHYLDGWPLSNTRCFNLGCAGSIMTIFSACLIGVQSSNSIWVLYIHLHTSTVGMVMNPPLCPQMWIK